MSVLPQRSSSLSNNDGGILRKGARMPGPLAPSGAVLGDIWYNTTNKTLNVWNGTGWDKITGAGISASGGNFTATGTIYANQFKVSPDDVDDAKIDLYGGSYLIGIRDSTMYFRAGGNSFQFETPPGSWAMRYGGFVNGTERGLWISGNAEASEIYSNGWFRSRANGTGWYSQTHGGGVFMDDGYVKIYGGKEFWAPNNKVRAEMARMGQSGPWADHVTFSHNNYQQDTNCGFMQRWDGWAWWRSSGQLGFTSRGGDIAWMDNSGGYADFRPNLVGLGGDPVVIAGSNQMGRGSSSIRWKDRIGNLLGVNESPIWKLQPVRYFWKEDEDGIHESRHEANARNPQGIAGFIAEEVAAVAPDAVNYDAGGIPSSLDSWVLLAYIVAGLQHLKVRIETLEKGIK